MKDVNYYYLLISYPTLICHTYVLIGVWYSVCQSASQSVCRSVTQSVFSPLSCSVGQSSCDRTFPYSISQYVNLCHRSRSYDVGVSFSVDQIRSVHLCWWVWFGQLVSVGHSLERPQSNSVMSSWSVVSAIQWVSWAAVSPVSRSVGNSVRLQSVSFFNQLFGVGKPQVGRSLSVMSLLIVISKYVFSWSFSVNLTVNLSARQSCHLVSLSSCQWVVISVISVVLLISWGSRISDGLSMEIRFSLQDLVSQS